MERLSLFWPWFYFEDLKMSSIVHIYRRYPTHESCIKKLESVRWGDKPLCPYCGSEKMSRHTEKTKTRWQCSWCKKSSSVTVGTIFHNSHVDLQRWFLLISLMFSAKKGLSAMQAARDLEMRRPTVWSMMHRIRRAMFRSTPPRGGRPTTKVTNARPARRERTPATTD